MTHENTVYYYKALRNGLVHSGFYWCYSLAEAVFNKPENCIVLYIENEDGYKIVWINEE